MFGEVCSDLAWEVIVVDDNSPDGTQEVARQLAATYGEDKIVLKPRAGKLGLGYVVISPELRELMVNFE
jgi:dolichol-phosphate mannosyltransferase